MYALHGFTGCPSSFADLDCQAITLFGHGASAPATRVVDFYEEVDRLLSALPAEPVHLLGYSLGARLALALALRYPHRVRELSLISANPGLPEEEERVQRRQSDSVWSKLLREQGIEAFVDAWQGLPLWRSQKTLPAVILEGQRELRLAHDASQLALALESLGTGKMPSLWPKLPSLEMPIRLLVGALDAKFHEISEDMCRLLPCAALHVLADCGHNAWLEKPEVVARLLREPVA